MTILYNITYASLPTHTHTHPICRCICYFIYNMNIYITFIPLSSPAENNAQTWFHHVEPSILLYCTTRRDWSVMLVTAFTSHLFLWKVTIWYLIFTFTENRQLHFVSVFWWSWINGLGWNAKVSALLQVSWCLHDTYKITNSWCPVSACTCTCTKLAPNYWEQYQFAVSKP